MEPDADRPAATRRDAIRYSGVVAGTGLLAGCAGNEPTDGLGSTDLVVDDGSGVTAGGTVQRARTLALARSCTSRRRSTKSRSTPSGRDR